MKTLKFLLKTFFFLFFGLYLIVVTYVYCNQVDMIFHKSKIAKDFKFTFDNDFEEVDIKSFDNTILHGLLFKSKNSKGLIFYLHGNAGAVDSWGDISKIYTDNGYDIFILDYRSFGKSSGNITDESQFNKDVSYAYKNMMQHYSQDKIVVVGYSIGTGPATILASDFKPKTLILQAPYYSLPDLGATQIPFIPTFLYKFKFETFKYISKVKCPIYIFHGDKDLLINISNSKKLQKLIKSGDKFFTLSDEDHIGINYNIDFRNQLKLILK